MGVFETFFGSIEPVVAKYRRFSVGKVFKERVTFYYYSKKE